MIAVLLALLLLSSPAWAWTADQPWRTVETEHFTIHYPVDSEAWALDLAARADTMRERVVEVVGYRPTRRTEIILMDPSGRANGFAMPYARTPLMAVFPTAPGPESGIGNYRLWAEDLVVHEDVHLVHMTRPSRSPLGHLVFDVILGVPPIAVRSPAWVIEGYATLVEGQLTGAGRPHSDSRATFLRALARAGQLPTYPQLDGSSRWQSGSMRYLVGSAFLEWLEAREGRRCLPELWARMTARELRGFDASFEGVFGEPAPVLYGRFVAELTAGALAVERGPDGAGRVLDLKRTVGAPAVSPDGSRVALVRRPASGPSELVVWETAEDTDAVHDRLKAEEDLLEADPEDVPAVPGEPPRAEVARRVHGGRPARDPRWLDEDTLVFAAWGPDRRGNFVPDLWTWSVERGAERRLTRGANLRDPEPCGDRILAIHREDGGSALAAVDRETATVTLLSAPDPTVVEARPRADDACRQAVVLRNAGGWSLQLWDLEAGTSRPLALPPGAQPLSADLRPDGTAVVLAAGRGGFIDLWERALPEGDWVRRTAGEGGAFSPDVGPDGAVWFLRFDPKGHDLMRLPADAPVPAEPTQGPLRDPAWTRGVVRPPPPAAPGLPEGPTPTPRAYRLGDAQVRPLFGAQGGVGPGGQATLDGGAFIGDLIGRSELVLLSGWDLQGRVRGLDAGRAAWTWRRLPVHPTVDLWARRPGAWTAGGGVDLRHDRVFAGGRAVARLGTFGELDPAGAPRPAAVGRVAVNGTAWTGALRWVGGLSGVGQAGAGLLGRGQVDLGLGRPDWLVLLQGELGVAEQGLVVGGLQRGTDSDLRTAHRMWAPGLGPPRSGREVLRLRGALRLRSDLVEIFGERVVVGPGGGGIPPMADGRTRAGAALDTGSAAQPIGKIPGLDAQVGLSCLLESEGRGWHDRPCAARSDWSLWTAVRWVPGRPPASP